MTTDTRVTIHKGAAALVAIALLAVGAGGMYLSMRNDGRPGGPVTNVPSSAGAQALARQNLTVVGQSYELGRVTVFEVLAERRRYLDVERAYTEALRAAYEARTALNRALGEGR